MRFFTLSPLPLVTVSTLLLMALTTTGGAPATAPSDASGHWEGLVQLPGKPLEVRVDLSNDGGKWTGKIDIPQQHASGLTLDPITIKGTGVRFTIRGVPDDPTFDGTLAAGRIS